jgi:RNA polymerase sigma factor (sigma-70 family)
MASGPSAAIADQLEALFRGGTAGGLTDGQLLDRFVRQRDEAAFAALVERHGPMVLRACRRRLGDAHDAEDAFQATFLVLARKAPSIRRSEAVAGWLLGVAVRVSAKARAADLRRLRAEQKIGVPRDLGTEDRPPEPWTELYEEVDRLPERYRLPVVLCHLEGLTYEQAAAHLRCPTRTIETRLVRARERLRRRLERRGLAPSAAVIGSAWLSEVGSAVVPTRLKRATAAAAFRFICGAGAAAGEGPAPALAGEVLRAMFFGKVIAAAGLALLLGLIGAAGSLARPGAATSSPRVSSPARQAGQRAVPPQQVPATRKDESPFRMSGMVRVEGTGEPVAGARVQVDLGTKDLSGEFRDAATDTNGRYTIPLPQGSARPLFFTPPPGYWLPEPSKHSQFFAITPQEPVYRKDYEVRRGLIWTFRLTRGPMHEPVVPGFVSSYALPGDFSISIREKTDPGGYATVTLPDEAVRVTISLSPKDREEGMALVKLDFSHGFRPAAIKVVNPIGVLSEPGEKRFRLTDVAGGTATIAGPVEVDVRDGKVILSANLPEPDPRSSGRIAGTVVDENGRPVASATVTLYSQYRQWGSISGRADHKVRSDAQGRFVLPSVAKRNYEGDRPRLSVIVYKDGYAGVDTDTFEFKPGDDGTQTVDPIRLGPGLSLHGKVVDPEGRPVVGAEIDITGGWAKMANTHRSGPEGRFTIPDLGRGVASVWCRFGTLQGGGSFVVDGKSEPVTVALRPAPRPGAVAAAQPPPRLLKAGEIAPNWVVRAWIDGKDRSIGELRGRVIVLDFWSLRSGEMTLGALDRLRAKFEPRGVVFLSIHTPDGNLDQIHKLYQLKQVGLVSAVDAGPEDRPGEGTTARMYGVRGFPWSLVIDRAGKVAFNSHDPANQAAMVAVVRKLGLGATKQRTEDQVARLFEAFHDEVIEKVLSRP